ncbi:hypothetical protein ACFXJM_07030 [Streptomyces massasporeus]
MSSAIKEVRTFSAIAIIGGIGAYIAGTLTGDTVPIALGVTAAAGGVILAAFTSLAHQKTRV